MFTLVNNRLKRSNASFIWLSKYFENQNPLEMPQETVVLLNAYTDGFFGPDSQGVCKKQIEKWLDFLAKDETRVKSLEEIWFNKIDLTLNDKINEDNIDDIEAIEDEYSKIQEKYEGLPKAIERIEKEISGIKDKYQKLSEMNLAEVFNLLNYKQKRELIELIKSKFDVDSDKKIKMTFKSAFRKLIEY